MDARNHQPVLEGPDGAGSIMGSPQNLHFPALAGLIGLRARDPDGVSAPVLDQVLDLNGGQFRAPDGAHEADQDQGRSRVPAMGLSTPSSSRTPLSRISGS